jgi:signal transduction histidine kinase
MQFLSDEIKTLPYHPTIGRKGLAMALIPVLLGSCFLVLLNYLWYSSNSLILRDQRRNELSVALSESFTAVTGYGYTVMNNAFLAMPLSKDYSVLERQNAEGRLAKLDSITASNVRQFAQERLIQHSLMDVLAETNRVAFLPVASRTISNVPRLNSSVKLMKRGLLLCNQIQTANQQQLADRRQLRKEQDFLQAALEAVVFITFACGSMISAVLFFDFAKSILSRVKVLTRNASSLARLEVPTEQIEGNDEIGYLDSCFRGVAAELTTARQEQQSIIQMIAHDMRSPIMAVQVSISTFDEFWLDALPERSIEWCEQIIAASNNVLSFVTELLTLESLESGDIELTYSDFSIRNLVQDCILSLSEQATLKSVSVENACQDTTVRADKSRIKQVVDTYLANAISFAPANTQVLVSSQTDDSFATVFVSDAGPSLSKLKRRQAFDRFSQTDNDDRKIGLGLGLFICRMLVESHGGKVGVTSESGKGRSFQFSLPKTGSGHSTVCDYSSSYFAVTEDHELNIRKWPAGLPKLLKQSLIGKVLLLVLLPFMAQAGCLMWIDYQLAKSQNLAMRERQQADIVSLIDELWLRGFRANVNSAFMTIYQKPEYQKRTVEDIQALRTMTVSIDALMDRLPRANGLWRDAKNFVRDETGRIEDRINQSASNDATAELEHITDSIAPALKLSGRMAQLTAEEVRILSAISEENEESRRQVQSFISLAIAFNILLSIGQWLALRQDITKRIAVLVDNARKLPVRGQLHEKMGGADEITVLDSLLHRAARELNESDRQRKYVVDMIAQNIGSPLGAIAHYLALLEIEAGLVTGLSAGGRETLVSARRNIDRIQMLSNDLFTIDQYSGLTNELDLCPCKIAEVIEESVASVASLANEKNIKLETDVSDVAVLIDRQRIIQVLVNLLANSIKFSPAGSSILIRAQAIAGSLQIIVQDRGPGMDKATKDRIFDKFFRAPNQNQKAFGLGLAICKLIVEAHGGQIGVETSPGKGSAFWIKIPATRGV